MHASYALDAFVVMPNHLHAIVVQEAMNDRTSLSTVIGLFKSRASRRAGCPIWQRSYHDRVIRDEEELAAFRDYIETNPLRWALDRENPERQRSEAGPVGDRPLQP